MASTEHEAEATAAVERLRDATNAHDVEAITACFTSDYRNETPAHPARSFTGREQVRRNWSQILTSVPDLETEIVASATETDTVWTEWEHRGTRPDGTAHRMCGVIVFVVSDGLIESARFFLEPVDTSGLTVDEAVRFHAGAGEPS